MSAILDSLRTWRERHPGDDTDWRAAQGNGWRSDQPTIETDASKPIMPDNAPAIDRLPSEPMRPGQRGLIYVKIKELAVLDSDLAATIKTWFEEPGRQDRLTKTQASDVIDRIKAKIQQATNNRPGTTPATMVDSPTLTQNLWAAVRELAAPLVDMGGQYGVRFAIDTQPGAANTVAFWWLTQDEGNGRYYLRQIIGGSRPMRVRLSPEGMISILSKIHAAGPYEAMLRFGREIGKCGHCGATLTNDESRARGIGPVCARKHG